MVLRDPLGSMQKVIIIVFGTAHTGSEVLAVFGGFVVRVIPELRDSIPLVLPVLICKQQLGWADTASYDIIVNSSTIQYSFRRVCLQGRGGCPLGCEVSLHIGSCHLCAFFVSCVFRRESVVFPGRIFISISFSDLPRAPAPLCDHGL